MKDQLEQFMRDRAEEFDNKQPVAKHRKRFEQRLKEQQGAGSSLRIWMAAASIIAVISVSFWLLNKPDSSGELAEAESVKQLSLQDVSSEMEEVEAYYLNAVTEKVTYLKKHYSIKDEHVASCLTIINNLEANYAELKQELAGNPASEQVIEAMVMNYQTRLDILDLLITQLQTQTIDTTSNLKTNEISL
jgi:DNA repair exonuclease SbcCD ATPase subunit